MKLTSDEMTDDVDDDEADDGNTNSRTINSMNIQRNSAANYIQEILEVIVCI